MDKKNILFLGFGDLATRIFQRLPGWRATAVARSNKVVPEGVGFWQMSVTDQRVLDLLTRFRFDAVVITLTPDGTGDEGYRAGYCEPLATLCKVWHRHPPAAIFFISSTSVYGQRSGEWVNESSPTEPEGFAGQRILEAERLLQTLEIPVCILRFAGIYGPGRDFLVRQVRAGNGGDESFTNRIHVDDGAAAVAFLVERRSLDKAIEPAYLVCDSGPAASCDVRAWIAVRLGLDPAQLTASDSGRGGHKRCSNARLLASGFQLQYPGFRDGYEELISGTRH